MELFSIRVTFIVSALLFLFAGIMMFLEIPVIEFKLKTS